MPAKVQHPVSFGNAFDRADGSEANAAQDQELAAFYRDRIEPSIKKFFLSRLRVSLRPTDDSRQNQDALDLCSEAKVLVLQKLRAADVPTEIRDLDAYVTTIASNVFNQFLRRKYPRRFSLRNQLRYLFTHHSYLALWKGDDDRWLCGRIEYQDRRDVQSIDLDEISIDRIHAKMSGTVARKLITLTETTFDLLGGPVFLDDLVAFACATLRIEEPVEIAEPENLAELTPLTGQATALDELEDNEFVRRLWEEIRVLPLRHRIALLMNYKEDAGEDLLSMLPLMGVATIRQIAAELGFDDEEFAKVWSGLPWDDNRIAEYLVVTRQQVINLRQSARQMLRRSLNAKG